MNHCVICQAQSHHTVYDKTTGTTVPVCMSHSNIVFEYGAGSFDEDFIRYLDYVAKLDNRLIEVHGNMNSGNLKGGFGK